MTLNDEQLAAVTQAIDRPLLILSGAGSGKTQVTVSRIKWMIEACGVPASQIVAMTFSNNAAKEMRHRLATIYSGGSPSQQPFIGTIHSFCAAVLREHAEHLGLSNQFDILEERESRALMREVLAELEAEMASPTAGEDGGQPRSPPKFRWLYDRVQRWRADGKEPWSVEPARGRIDPAHALYERYRVRCEERNAIDFMDLLLHTKRLWTHCPAVLAACQARWTHALVDEFQDTDPLQYKLIRTLFGPRITVVGDDYQTIHGWRGACIDNILRFQEQNTGATVAKLCRNYRSHERVVQAAQALILNNVRQLHKIMTPTRPPGERLLVVRTTDWNVERKWIVQHAIRPRLAAHPERTVCILTRTNADLEPFEPMLIQHSIPYALASKSAVPFLERSFVRTALAHLAAVYGVCSDDQFRIVATADGSSGRLGKSLLRKLEEFAITHGVSLLQASRHSTLLASVSDKKREALLELGRVLERTKGATLLTTYMTCEANMAGQDYADPDDDEGDEDEQGASAPRRRLTMVRQMMHALVAHNSGLLGSCDQRIQDWLYQLYTYQHGAYRDSANSVSLLTLHASKGLQFDTVIIANAEQEQMPLTRHGYIGEEALQEERRLFYVGLTRAIHEAIITYRRKPSPFIAELPPEHVLAKHITIASQTNKRQLDRSADV